MKNLIEYTDNTFPSTSLDSSNIEIGLAAVPGGNFLISPNHMFHVYGERTELINRMLMELEDLEGVFARLHVNCYKFIFRNNRFIIIFNDGNRCICQASVDLSDLCVDLFSVYIDGYYVAINYDIAGYAITQVLHDSHGIVYGYGPMKYYS